MNGIASAQVDLEVMKALKQGDQVLKDLQKQCSIEDWEELYDSHKENLQMHDMDVEMFGEVLKDDELARELDALVADQVKDEIADLQPLTPIKKQA